MSIWDEKPEEDKVEDPRPPKPRQATVTEIAKEVSKVKVSADRKLRWDEVLVLLKKKSGTNSDWRIVIDEIRAYIK